MGLGCGFTPAEFFFAGLGRFFCTGNPLSGFPPYMSSRITSDSARREQRGNEMKHRASLAIVTAALLLLGLSWRAHDGHDHGRTNRTAGAEESQTLRPQSSAQSTVAIKLFQYQPGRVQVVPGTTVTWVNEDDIFHSVTADKKEPGFDAPLDGKGKSFRFTFSQPGTYAYHCERHEHMRGEIEVK
jgi:plastocyanin